MVDRREIVGYLIMAMLTFSLVASVIPMQTKAKIKLGPTWFPFERGGEFLEELDPNDITFKLQAGELKVVRSSVHKPIARISGFKTDEGVAVGEVILELPANWSGKLNLSVRMGKVDLSDVEVGDLTVRVSMGSLEGTVKVLRSMNVEGVANNVDATVIVPEGVKVVLNVEARKSKVLLDGKLYEGVSQSLTSGEGPDLPINVRAEKVELVIVRG